MKAIRIALAIVFWSGLAGCQGGKEAPADARQIELSVTDRGFEPSQAVVPRGQAFTLLVTRTSNQTCATEIVIPALGQRHDLPLNQTVRIEIPAGVEDTLRFACGMDMFRGAVVAS